MKISRSMKATAALVAKAYIAAKRGLGEEAGEFMVAAAKSDDLDIIMHGVATSMGIDEDEIVVEDEDYDDVEASDEYEDMEAGDDEEEEEVDNGDVNTDENEDEEDSSYNDDEKEEVEVKETVAIPASCIRLAKMRY